MLAGEKRSLSELIAPLRRYATSGEISRRVSDPQALIRAVEAQHRGAPEVSKMDGLLVRYEDWWFSLRPSNTEPLLRLNLEGMNQDAFDAGRARVMKLLGNPVDK